MSEDVYRELARRLDAIPNGFTATESGVELRLPAKIFTPREAALAAVMRLTREPAADIARSDFRAVVDVAVCAGCGDCVEYCQFGALSVPEYVCTVDYAHCVGCGLCAAACSTGAMRLERRPGGEVSLPPADIKEWMDQRAEGRNISIFDVL